MPFDKDKSKNPTMTTKDQQNKPVQVVSTPSSEPHIDEIHSMPNTGEREFVAEEAGHPIDFSMLEDDKKVPANAQAVSGGDPGNYEGFTPTKHINKMNVEDLNDFMRASVIARPVRLPARLNARSKDPNFRLRWVECKAEDGRRFNDCESMGFRPAKPEEVVGLDRTVKVGPDKLIRADDLVLMIIPCEIIDGYLKHNALSALRMVSRQGSTKLAKKEGDDIMRRGIADAGFNPNSKAMKDAFGRPKLELYDPNA